MQRASDTRECTPQYRARRFQPPDPIEVSSVAVSLCRKRLAAFDRDVTIWWSEPKQCWRVMRWMENDGSWQEQLTWCGPNGEYRDIDAPDAIVNAIGSMHRSFKEAVAECDAHNDRVEKKKEDDYDDLKTMYRRQRWHRYQGIQSFFAMNDATPRKRAEVLFPEEDPEWIKEQRRRGNTRYGHE